MSRAKYRAVSLLLVGLALGVVALVRPLLVLVVLLVLATLILVLRGRYGEPLRWLWRPPSTPSDDRPKVELVQTLQDEAVRKRAETADAREAAESE